MKSAIKLVLVGAALIGGAANAANINTLGGAAGGSSLVLLLKDSTTSQFYFEEMTGINVDALRTKAQVAADPNIYNIDGNGTTGPLNGVSALNFSSANLTAFVTSHAGDNITWTILGTDTTGGTQAAGSQRAVFTSTLDMINGNSFWDSAGVAATAQNMNSFFKDDINTHTFTNGVSTQSGWGDTTQGLHAPDTWASIGNGAAVGTAQTLFMVSTEGAGADANVYATSYSLTLNASGAITGAPTSAPVPLPAAVWLLGSGLLGLLGVGRRRNATQVA